MLQVNTAGINGTNYYSKLKREFLPVIKEGPNVVLDLGCGTGRMGQALLEMNKASEIIGVELNREPAEEAEKSYDVVYKNNIEHLSLPYVNYFDYVLCGDILEHLVDPWLMLARINVMLKKNGELICSIPNIRYWKIIRDLVMKGRWKYADAGILDSTHLRFFTKSSFIEMLHNANYKVTWLHMSIHGTKRIANNITFNMLSEFLATQIMISARKN